MVGLAGYHHRRACRWRGETARPAQL